MENKAARQYLTRIKRALVCDKNDRCRLLERCGAMIDDFQQENPGTGYDDLVAAFGDPESFVAELLSGLESPKVEAAQKRRRLVRLGAVAAVIAALILTSVFWYVKFIKTRDLNENVIIVQGPVQPLTEEELREHWENIQPGSVIAYGEGYDESDIYNYLYNEGE